MISLLASHLKREPVTRARDGGKWGSKRVRPASDGCAGRGCGLRALDRLFAGQLVRHTRRRRLGAAEPFADEQARGEQQRRPEPADVFDAVLEPLRPLAGRLRPATTTLMALRNVPIVWVPATPSTSIRASKVSTSSCAPSRLGVTVHSQVLTSRSPMNWRLRSSRCDVERRAAGERGLHPVADLEGRGRHCAIGGDQNGRACRRGSSRQGWPGCSGCMGEPHLVRRADRSPCRSASPAQHGVDCLGGGGRRGFAVRLQTAHGHIGGESAVAGLGGGIAASARTRRQMRETSHECVAAYRQKRPATRPRLRRRRPMKRYGNHEHAWRRDRCRFATSGARFRSGRKCLIGGPVGPILTLTT